MKVGNLKLRKLIRFLVGCIFDSFLVTLSYLIPKDKNLYLFTSHDGDKFKGNPRYLYKYFQDKKKVVWITNNKKLKNELLNLGINAVYTFSARGIWSTLRAKYIIVDSSILGPFALGFLAFLGNFRIIQTWHGTGWKNTGLLDPNCATKMARLYSKAIFKSFYLMLASSEMDQEQFRKSFGTDKVVITGLPRNDVFFNNKLRFRDYKTELKLYQYKKVILYAPTFRETQDANPFDIDFLQKIDDWLERKNYILLIKKHPYDKSLKVGSNYRRIWDVTEKVDDIQELLICSDILISDYSSVVTDFVITNRPIIFYMYDLEKYVKNCRSFYYNIYEILPGPFAYNQEELFTLLKDMSWFDDPDYKIKYERFRDMFHKYKDGKSCERVEKILMEC